jgi:hypothetical protein
MTGWWSLERIHGLIRDQWYELAARLNEVDLNDDKDKVVWKWITIERFTVKSVYDQLTKTDSGPSFKTIWKTKIPEKNKIFMWLVGQKVILTKDNLARGILGAIFVVILRHHLFSCRWLR